MVDRIELGPRAREELAALERSVRHRLLAAIERLVTNPRPAGSKKLAGRAAWRIRVGEYRVIYEITDKRLVVLVIRVGHPHDVYRERSLTTTRRGSDAQVKRKSWGVIR